MTPHNISPHNISPSDRRYVRELPRDVKSAVLRIANAKATSYDLATINREWRMLHTRDGLRLPRLDAGDSAYVQAWMQRYLSLVIEEARRART